MCNQLPNSVRYVKNGMGGQWWQAAHTNGQVHLGWRDIPPNLLLNPTDFAAIRQIVRDGFGPRRGAQADFRALCTVLEAPSQHIWVTFEDGCMWWCTVNDGVTVNPDGQTAERGYFWLTCNRPWSNTSLNEVNDRRFAMTQLPGTVTAVAGFQGVVYMPSAWDSIVRLIKGETNPDVKTAIERRGDHELAVNNIVQQLSPIDFEHLIDLILARTGWDRISTLGKTQEGIDMEAENPTTGEIAFVQVKSTAAQEVLDDYVERFKIRRDRYARMIFAVHTLEGIVNPPVDIPEVRLWTGEIIAELVVRVGLGKWVENRLA
jgi:hypothetical protein